MDSVESAVLDAARYLREVRPLDPAELVEYVPPDVAPERVVAILRANAVDLGVVERDDGTFAPPPTGPIDHDPSMIDALPARLERLLVEVLAEAHGDSWWTGETGDRLRAAVRSLKARYLEGGAIDYTDDDASAYLIYHFPRSYAATRSVLGLLTERGLLGHRLDVLDVGAGVGAHYGALADVVPADALVAYRALEPTALADRFVALADRLDATNVHLELERRPVESTDLDAAYDLVLLGNVLSEVADPEAVARTTFDALAPEGAWIAIAPADPRTSVQLRAIERTLVPPAEIYAPTLRLWDDRQPTDDLWSFVEQPAIDRPTVQRRLGEPAAASERRQYTNTDVRYSYSILRTDGRRRFEVRASPDRVAPLGEVADAVGKRVNALVVKLSGDLAEDDHPLYRVGDGSQTDPCFAVVVAQTATNAALLAAPYGAVVALERALVLWNADEAAINLVVDEATMIERIAP